MCVLKGFNFTRLRYKDLKSDVCWQNSDSYYLVSYRFQKSLDNEARELNFYLY